MSISLGHKTVKASKDHKCNFCGGAIVKGTEYLRTGVVYENRVFTWKSHFQCDRICSKLNMEGDEGVTSDDFWEYITDEYYKLLADKEEPEDRTHYEMLEIVCANHLNSQL